MPFWSNFCQWLHLKFSFCKHFTVRGRIRFLCFYQFPLNPFMKSYNSRFPIPCKFYPLVVQSMASWLLHGCTADKCYDLLWVDTLTKSELESKNIFSLQLKYWWKKLNKPTYHITIPCTPAALILFWFVTVFLSSQEAKMYFDPCQESTGFAEYFMDVSVGRCHFGSYARCDLFGHTELICPWEIWL